MTALGSIRPRRTLRALLLSATAIALALAPRGASAAGGQRPTPVAAAGQRPTPVADESLALATPKSLAAAVEAIERATGVHGERLELGG